MSKTGNGRSAERSPVIAFRLTLSQYDDLAAMAESSRLSVGQFARHLVLQTLAGDTTVRLASELADLHSALETLDEHLAAATIAILHDAGKADLCEAVEWVHTNIRPEKLSPSYPDGPP